MPLSAAAIQADLEGRLNASGWNCTTTSAKVLTSAIAATIFNQLTTVAKVNGGVCVPSGPIANGVIS